jgi:hypothetical protein
MIHSTNSIVRLAFARQIPLVAWPSTVVVTLSVVVTVTAQKMVAFLLLFICPVLHHIS